MAHQITEIAELKKYMNELTRTGRQGDSYPRLQHATNISLELVVLIGGWMLMCADDGSIQIGTQTTNGVTRDVNQIWFTVQGRSWALIYSGTYGRIELRARTRIGPTTHILDRNMTPIQVSAVFAAL